MNTRQLATSFLGGVLDRWRTSRLLQFLVLGGALFAIAPGPERDDTIAIERDQVHAVAELAARRAGHLVASGDDRALANQLIEDELAFREALRLGLDRSDNIVRQRLIQKVLFLAEDLGGAWKPPTDDELRAYFVRTREHWQRPDMLRVAHVYFQRRADADQMRARLPENPTADGIEETLAAIGDPLPIPRVLAATPASLAGQLGPELAAGVAALPAGTWSEPLPSRLGFHVVRILERRPGGPARFEDVRDALRLAYVADRKQRAIAQYFSQAAEHYRITVGGESFDYQPTGRTATATVGE